MLVKSVSFNDFLEEFEKHGKNENFSYEGKKALYNYLNELSEDIGEPIKLDIIGLCCDFTEYSDLKEFNDDYGYSIDDVEDVEDIKDYTTVIRIDDNSFIIQDF